MDRRVFGSLLVTAACLFGLPASADQPTYGPELQGFDYPWPVREFSFSSQGEAMTMRYICAI